MANKLKPASTFIPARAPIVDPDGMATWSFLKILQGWDTKLSNGLNQIGQLIGEINAQTKIAGRTEGIGTTVGHIDTTGIVQSTGLVVATDAAHGAVTLPAGATTSTLGSAALQPDTAFDVAGAASIALATAEAFASAAALTAQTNAQTFSSNASNLTSGILDTARISGLTAVIVTAKLTVGGVNGSQTFTNGILTASTPAT